MKMVLKHIKILRSKWRGVWLPEKYVESFYFVVNIKLIVFLRVHISTRAFEGLTKCKEEIQML